MNRRVRRVAVTASVLVGAALPLGLGPMAAAHAEGCQAINSLAQICTFNDHSAGNRYIAIAIKKDPNTYGIAVQCDTINGVVIEYQLGGPGAFHSISLGKALQKELCP